MRHQSQHSFESLIQIRPVTDILTLYPALAISQQEGYRFVLRLIEEWNAGSNMFDGQGEILLACFCNRSLCGFGGVNLWNSARDFPMARLRRFYIMPTFRRLGVGTALATELLIRSSHHFRKICVHTDTERGAAFYESLGFKKAESADFTHWIDLEPVSDAD